MVYIFFYDKYRKGIIQNVLWVGKEGVEPFCLDSKRRHGPNHRSQQQQWLIYDRLLVLLLLQPTNEQKKGEKVHKNM